MLNRGKKRADPAASGWDRVTEDTDLQAEPYVVVVGGGNVDIGGHSARPLVSRDSNPGIVQTSPGGVGRNIAHNLCLMGADVRLLTAFGDDTSAQLLMTSCQEIGIDISGSVQIPGASTSSYLFLTGPDGDMELALSDMEIYEQITPEFLAARAELLNHARLVVIDTNLPEKSVVWLARNCKAPLFADPVSTHKAVKLCSVLGKLHTLKPNLLEAELLSGVAITDAESLRRCAATLLATGLQRVFISLGASGVYAADHSGDCYLPCLTARAVNATGCGDAYMAAVAWSHLHRFPICTDWDLRKLPGLALQRRRSLLRATKPSVHL